MVGVGGGSVAPDRNRLRPLRSEPSYGPEPMTGREKSETFLRFRNRRPMSRQRGFEDATAFDGASNRADAVYSAVATVVHPRGRRVAAHAAPGRTP